jgi:hypothetical protein
MEPFMRNNITTEICKDSDILEEKLILLENALSDDIKNFYRKIGSSTQEIYINSWSLFSIDNILNLNKNYKNDNITITDLGLKYEGMGHCKVAFYDPQTNMIYYRFDGGSSGWDRQYNFKNLQNYKSDEKIIGLTFETFLQEINKEKPESHPIF